jgi:hypothetical protein
MKRLLISPLCFLFAAFCAHSQCASVVTLGSSSNAYSAALNGLRPITVDADLNKIVFVHRNNTNIQAGPNSILRYDVSDNGGLTWVVNQDTLNPQMLNAARYPNALIYNPPGNTNPNNAYISTIAPAVDTLVGQWGSRLSSSVKATNSAVASELYLPLPGSGLASAVLPLTQSRRGKFWHIVPITNQANRVTMNLYAGSWDNGIQGIGWTLQDSIVPSGTNPLLSGELRETPQIAFDPSGKFGYIVYLGHLGDSLPKNLHPIVFSSVDSGATWSPAHQFDFVNYTDPANCIKSIADLFVSQGYVPSTDFECAITVDKFGTAHILSALLPGTGTGSIYIQSPYGKLVDYSFKALTSTWHTTEIAPINKARTTLGTAPNTIAMDYAEQASRTADGSKLFFMWSDASSGNPKRPELYFVGVDVDSNKRTSAKLLQDCLPNNEGIYFPHAAEISLQFHADSLRVPMVATLLADTNSTLLPSTYTFIKNVAVGKQEYTAQYVPPIFTASIAGPDTVSYCAGAAPVMLYCSTTDSANASYYWVSPYTQGPGSQTLSLFPQISGYVYVYASNGCAERTDSVYVRYNVANLSISANGPLSFCSGDSITLSAFSLNGINQYAWSTGSLLDTTVVKSTGIYTIAITDVNGCTTSSTISIVVHSLPVITTATTPNDTVCAGTSVALAAASIGNSISWSGGIFNAQAFTPSANSSYTVTATSLDGCTSSSIAMIAVFNMPVLSTTLSNLAPCEGDTVTVTANGASAYEWNSGDTTPAISITQTATLSVVGSNGPYCKDTANILVSFTAISISGQPTDKAVLVGASTSFSVTASGTVFQWQIDSAGTWINLSNGATYNGVNTNTLQIIAATLAMNNSRYRCTVGEGACFVESNSATLLTSFPSAINDDESSKISVYPTSTTDKIFIERTQGSELQYSLVNAQGTLILSGTTVSKNFNLSLQHCSQGFYFLNLSAADQTVTHKIVKQ